MTSDETSSYSVIDHERDPDPAEDDEPCCRRYSPVDEPEEFCNLLSILAVSSGMLLIAVGYIYPRDYEFDPYEKARVMESVELYYNKLAFALDVLILTGMGMVGIGGLVYSVLFLRMMVSEEGVCWSGGKEDGVEMPLRGRMEGGGSGYGATGALQ